MGQMSKDEFLAGKKLISYEYCHMFLTIFKKSVTLLRLLRIITFVYWFEIKFDRSSLKTKLYRDIIFYLVNSRRELINREKMVKRRGNFSYLQKF